jgi:ABC-type transport system involved in multi-copper enzyme maturation permease subunit
VEDSRPSPRHSSFDARHIGLIAWFAGRFEIRKGGGIVFLFVSLFVGLEIANVFISSAENAIAGRNRRGEPDPDADVGGSTERLMKSEVMRDAVGWATGADERQTDYLVRDNPGLISAIALVLLFAFPFFAAFGSFNQTAGDISSRGLRYLLLRTERPNVFLGRLLGTFSFIVAFAVLLMGVVILYVGLKLRVYDTLALLGWGAQCVVAFCMIALPYVALCSWISGSLSSAGGSLVLCALATAGPLGVIWIVEHAAPVGDYGWVWKLLPWGWKWNLLSHDVGERLIGYGAMLGFTALYLAVGLWAFRRRDL